MQDAMPSKWLVETDWLASRLDAPDLVVVDASLHLPTTGRNAKAEYLAEHIPGALFFDIDDISDEKNPLPHMLPSTVEVRQPHEEDGHRRRHARRSPTTARGSTRRRARGGCSAPWATTTWRC